MPSQQVPIVKAASQARRILDKLGIQHSVGTSWNSAGAPVVVVDIPANVDTGPVERKLSRVGAEIVVRNVVRTIVAHSGQPA
jgi:hypothetical protein